MSEQRWVKVAEEDELQEGLPVPAKAGKDSVLLVRLQGQIHACGEKCTHYGGPLSEGVLLGSVITCPWHTARFDVKTGKMVSPPALDSVGCYEVKVEDGGVYVGRSQKPKPSAPEGEDSRTFVIVGAGAAGNAAAETLRDEGFAGRIALITAEPERPYDRPTLSKEFMSGEASRRWLPLHSTKFYETLGIELLTERRVESLDPVARTVTFADGVRVKFDCALVATGGVPRRPDIPGAELPGFFLLRSLADAEVIAAALEAAERVVVLGAGFIGMEIASSLRERELEVHIVAPEDVPMARVFGEEVGKWLQRCQQKEGVRFHLGATAKEIRGGAAVQEVLLSDGSRIAADLVVAGLGIRPAVGCLEGTGLVENGAVPVDETLETRAEGIYAAGDIAVVPSPQTGGAHRVEHWVVAERQGQHAARAMLGCEAPYREVPFFWTHQCGISLKYVGYEGEYDAFAVRGSIEEGDFLAGYYTGGRLRAVSGVGRAKELIAASEILKAGKTIPFEDFEALDTGFVELIPRD